MVPGSGVVEEVAVWQDFTHTYRLQLNPKLCKLSLDIYSITILFRYSSRFFPPR